MKNDRITLSISVPIIKPDANWNGWDLETFILSEHIHSLIRAYGIEIIISELKDCKNFNKIPPPLPPDDRILIDGKEPKSPKHL